MYEVCDYKICNRCQFRVAIGRAACQVCGHKRFLEIEPSTSKLHDVKELLSGLQLQCARVKELLKSVKPQSLPRIETSAHVEIRETAQKISRAFKKITLLVMPMSTDTVDIQVLRKKQSEFDESQVSDFAEYRKQLSIERQQSPRRVRRVDDQSVEESTDRNVTELSALADSLFVLGSMPSRRSRKKQSRENRAEIAACKKELERLRVWFQHYGKDGLIRQRQERQSRSA